MVNTDTCIYSFDTLCMLNGVVVCWLYEVFMLSYHDIVQSLRQLGNCV